MFQKYQISVIITRRVVLVVKVEFLPDILKILQQLFHAHLLAGLVHDVVHLVVIIIIIAILVMTISMLCTSSSKLCKLRLRRSAKVVSSLIVNFTRVAWTSWFLR